MQQSRISSQQRMFQVIALLVFALEFARCNKALKKPVFTYIERRLVQVCYQGGVNTSLYMCCIRDGPRLISSCGEMAICPENRTATNCRKTANQKVLCKIDYVQDRVTMQAYVGRSVGTNVVKLSEVAEFVTNKSAKTPRPVSRINISMVGQGLEIRWTPLRYYEFSFPKTKYNYVVECQPTENRRAKAALAHVSFDQAFFYVSSKNLTAVSEYQCCVNVVNVLNSLESDQRCQNIKTPEQAPNAAPVITCSNGTAKECPSVTKGTRRNITIEFQLPSPEHRNGHIMYSVVYYSNMTDDNFTRAQVVNGSKNTAELVDVGTAKDIIVFVKSCTKVGCSPASDTAYMRAKEYKDKISTTEYPVFIVVPCAAAVVLLVMAVILYLIKRRRHLQRQHELPALKPQDTRYEYPPNTGHLDEHYHELESVDNSIVVANPVALEQV